MRVRTGVAPAAVFLGLIACSSTATLTDDPDPVWLVTATVDRGIYKASVATATIQTDSGVTTLRVHASGGISFSGLTDFSLTVPAFTGPGTYRTFTASFWSIRIWDPPASVETAMGTVVVTSVANGRVAGTIELWTHGYSGPGTFDVPLEQ